MKTKSNRRKFCSPKHFRVAKSIQYFPRFSICPAFIRCASVQTEPNWLLAPVIVCWSMNRTKERWLKVCPATKIPFIVWRMRMMARNLRRAVRINVSLCGRTSWTDCWNTRELCVLIRLSIPRIQFSQFFISVTMIRSSVWHSIRCRINCCRAHNQISHFGPSNRRRCKSTKFRRESIAAHGPLTVSIWHWVWPTERCPFVIKPAMKRAKSNGRAMHRFIRSLSVRIRLVIRMCCALPTGIKRFRSSHLADRVLARNEDWALIRCVYRTLAMVNLSRWPGAIKPCSCLRKMAYDWVCWANNTIRGYGRRLCIRMDRQWYDLRLLIEFIADE